MKLRIAFGLVGVTILLIGAGFVGSAEGGERNNGALIKAGVALACVLSGLGNVLVTVFA